MELNDAPLAPGFKFEPKDEEVMYFLTRVALGRALPVLADKCIRRVTLYGERTPGDIFADEFPAKRVFFALTNLINASTNRIKRTAGGGTWKGQGVKTEIRVGGEVVGEKCTLSYVTGDNGANSTTKKKTTTHWNMTEYRLLNFHSYKNGSCTAEEARNQTEWVFCRVAYSGKRKEQTSQTLENEAEVGIKRWRLLSTNSSVTTFASTRGREGQEASQCFYPQQGIFLEEHELHQQQPAAPSNDNKVGLEMIESELFGSHDMDASDSETMQLEETCIYKELLSAATICAGGGESSGAQNGEQGLVLKQQQPVAMDFGRQLNSDDWRITATVQEDKGDQAAVCTSATTATMNGGLSAAAAEEQELEKTPKTTTDHVINKAWSWDDILPGQVSDSEIAGKDEDEEENAAFASFLKTQLEEEKPQEQVLASNNDDRSAAQGIMDLQKRREHARKELEQMRPAFYFNDYDLMEEVERMNGRHLTYLPRKSIYGAAWVVSERDHHNCINTKAEFEKLAGLVLKEPDTYDDAEE